MMNPNYYTIHVGDCLETLKGLPDSSIHTCITSPPYWGLRDYGVDGQIGLEESFEKYVEKMVEVFREVKRVLRDDGTVWLNLGDSYAGSGGPGSQYNKLSKGEFKKYKNPNRNIDKLKAKDLVGIPWMVAFALRADGWYLRQDIIWNKPNPMPEPVRDRCTKAHDYIFLLSKSPQYFYDADAIREKTGSEMSWKEYNKKTAPGKTWKSGGITKYAGANKKDGGQSHPAGRNKRSVWTITTKPFKGAHFATFPLDLIEPCVLAGCPVNGTVLDPFGGSGTTACAALKHGRSAILCELNPDYAELAENRIEDFKKTIGMVHEKMEWV